VQNGATLRVQNGSIFGLEGGQMDFGPVGATARLGETGSGRVTEGTLTATRALDTPSGVDVAGLGAAISASVYLGAVTVTRGHAIQTGGGNESIERYYDIAPSQNNAGLSATLTHGYADAELNGRAESDLELFKSDDGGATWSRKGAGSRDAAANTVTLSGIERFSRWTLGASSQPLPVELVSFEGAVVESGGGTAGRSAVRLTWTTASEAGNAGFEVQRRAETGASWKRVGYRSSKAEGGTTGQSHTYRFTDKAVPYAADSLRYRLRQMDLDGTTTLSAAVVVQRGAPDQLRLEAPFPNPARTGVTLRYVIPATTDARIELFNVLGQRIAALPQGAGPAGRVERHLDTSRLSNGLYFVRLTADGQVRTQRLSVVR
jgi:hypothetical protein